MSQMGHKEYQKLCRDIEDETLLRQDLAERYKQVIRAIAAAISEDEICIDETQNIDPITLLDNCNIDDNWEIPDPVRTVSDISPNDLREVVYVGYAIYRVIEKDEKGIVELKEFTDLYECERETAQKALRSAVDKGMLSVQTSQRGNKFTVGCDLIPLDSNQSWANELEENGFTSTVWKRNGEKLDSVTPPPQQPDRQECHNRRDTKEEESVEAMETRRRATLSSAGLMIATIALMLVGHPLAVVTSIIGALSWR